MRENRGCPDTDKDGDGVVDRLDNGPTEPGDQRNQGCKAPQKVVITASGLEITDSVYFKLDKAIIEKRYAQPHAAITYLDIVLDEGASWQFAPPAGHTIAWAFVYAMRFDWAHVWSSNCANPRATAARFAQPVVGGGERRHDGRMNAIRIETMIDEATARAIPALRPLLGKHVELIALDASPVPLTERKLAVDELLALRIKLPPGVGPLSLEAIERAIAEGALGR